jgi:hypothetical protein
VDSLFDEYNKRLIQADILPNLRYEVRKQAGGIEIIEKQVGRHDVNAADEAAYESGEDPHQSPSELGDELFGRICELMSGRHGRSHGSAGGHRKNVSPIGGATGPTGAAGPAGGGGYSGVGTAASSGGGTLLGQIGNLQRSIYTTSATATSDEFIENIEIDQHFIDRLQDTLANEREEIYSGVDRRKLASADTDVIELVGMMFEFMLKETQLPNLVKALLSRLHTPLLKVGVMDRSFFTHQGHPARKLLDDMTAAGIRWVDEAHIERGIFPKMKELVDRVLQDFTDDIRLFSEVLEEFSAAVAELQLRASRVEERTNEAANGQERLQAARTRAHQEIRGLSQGAPLAVAARDFLQSILADKLTFILLRSERGDESDDWQAATDLTARIIASVQPPADDRQRNTRRQALDDLQRDIRQATGTLQQSNKEKLLHALFELQTEILSDDTIRPIAAEPLPEEPSARAGTGRNTMSAEQEKMLEKLKSIPFGTWFDFGANGEASRRAKLSWRSTVTEKFMFVDQMGVRAAVVSMHDLADDMLKGTVTIVAAEKKPFVDRALGAIYRMLDHAA